MSRLRDTLFSFVRILGQESREHLEHTTNTQPAHLPGTMLDVSTESFWIPAAMSKDDLCKTINSGFLYSHMLNYEVPFPKSQSPSRRNDFNCSTRVDSGLQRPQPRNKTTAQAR
jgi:hypothetical protein